MRLILPIVFIVTAIALFWVVINPSYVELVALKAQEKQFEDTISQLRELQSIQDELLLKYNSIRSSDLARLEKLLPDNIDNVRLILDLDSIASARGVEIGSVALKDLGGQGGGSGANTTQDDGSGSKYESVMLSFTTKTSYETFLSFLADIEQSLRLIDVTSLSVVPVEDEFSFRVSLQTYWLK